MFTTVSLFLIESTSKFKLASRNNTLLMDPEADALFADGELALTWRRYGQDFPHEDDASDAGAFSTDDDTEEVIKHLVAQLVKQLGKNGPKAHVDDIDDAVRALVNKVEAAQQTGDDWQYRHSTAYFRLVDATLNGEVA